MLIMSRSARAGSFNPRTPCGVRPGPGNSVGRQYKFQSTHSLRSATGASGFSPCPPMFQSTHSLRSATNDEETLTWAIYVSIHALLAECDINGGQPRTTKESFNPRTPCGVRQYATGRVASSCKFQSTHSLRSATKWALGCVSPCAVSIHALLAECDKGRKRDELSRTVSIHALLAECDSTGDNPRTTNESFNPRTPCGVRPYSSVIYPSGEVVSIHALLAECDINELRISRCQ